MAATSFGGSDRKAKLARLFNGVLHGRHTIRDQRNAGLFIEAICDQPDPSVCAEQLISSHSAMSALHSSLRFDMSPSFLNEHTTRLLAYFEDSTLQSLCNGNFLRRLLSIIVEPSSLWNSMLDAGRSGNLKERASQSLAWLIWQLLSLQAQEPADLRSVARLLTKECVFIDSPRLETRVYGQKIKHILSIISTQNDTSSDQSGPGGRHDNDFVDFRKIAILPTADELSSTETPYYIRTSEVVEAEPDQRMGRHLDNQFRLLREDMLGELRADIRQIKGVTGGKRSPLVLSNLLLKGLSCGNANFRKPCALSLLVPSDLPRLRGLPDLAARKQFLENHLDLIRHESVACLFLQSQVVAFGAISRNLDQLSQDPPIITLQITDNAAFSRALLAAKSEDTLTLMQVDAPVFAYQPVLQCLQTKTEIALASELFSVSQSKESPMKPEWLLDQLDGSEGCDIQNVLGATKPIVLDSSQLQSLLSGLSQSVSLIQGPPGTGKSFIGALIAKALIDNTSETLLVVTFTNHALDQFLEDLMDIGIPSTLMVRLGSKNKSSARTQPLLLQNQTGRSKLSQTTWAVVNNLRPQADSLAHEIETRTQEYLRYSLNFSDLMEMLEFSEDQDHFFNAFQMIPADDDMEIVGHDGKAISAQYLFDRWRSNRDAGIFHKQSGEKFPRVWDLDITARKNLLNKWTAAILKDRVTVIEGLVRQYSEIERHLADIFRENVQAVFKEKRIIACTTTAAAKYARDISAGSPGVIIVEEAGEILESHILTALGPNTKQLILIGDHKQLRPKVNNFKLTIEYGSGYNLNQSLFERMVRAGFPHTTLLKQHRMAPEISSLVRALTYPGLIDAPSTQNRPALQGFQSRVIFFDHRHVEHEDSQIVEKRDPNVKISKQNPFEVDMVLRTVKYLGQQGYGTDDVVILTPYLGQLYLLKSRLSATNDPVLNDLDTHDLVEAGLLPAASATGTKRKIKLSTIDNYQGEESDVVVTSLTRSNSIGDIGFMASPERVNVLLSRARNGLILIGNAETFMSSPKGRVVWKPLMEHLRKSGSIFDGLPVKCERHPHRMALIRSPEDFDTECPDGGCAEPCGVMLNCGQHSCSHRCHQLTDHSKMRCTKLIDATCASGHRTFRNCYMVDSTKKCLKCIQEQLALEKRLERDAKLEASRERNQQRYAQQLAIIQDEIEHERSRAQENVEQEARESAMLRAKQELKDLKVTTARRQATHRASVGISPSAKLACSSTLGSSKCTETAGHHAAPSTKTSEAEVKRLKLPLSSAQEEWENEKELMGASNDALDEIMQMIGLEDVKEQFLTIKSKVDLVVRQSTSLNQDRFSAALLGNPGTGKTTVARIYAKFLSSVGILPGSHFIEASGSELANGGINICQKHIDSILKQGGGALFIDEAYQLVSGSSWGGRAVLDFLLTQIENLTGKVVFILAGYNKQMEAFFAHNPGIPSRVPIRFDFKDYNDAELQQILESQIQQRYKGSMSVEGGLGGLYLRIVARRVGTGRGREGFGNARAVANVFAQITDRQASRFRRANKSNKVVDANYLTKEDLIGPEPTSVLENNAAWKKLHSLVGLTSVKDSVKALLHTLQTNYQLELEEKPYIQTSLNKVLLGSPGTGKTSVAKLYGQILADIGMLSNGEVIVKNPSDFIGSVLGQSEANTKAILKSTLGKVLVIDEAYMLNQTSGGTGGFDSYSGKVIDTLVAEVQSTPGEDRCVLLLGYKEQMEDMLQNVNPGLARRFPLSNAFYFEDFDDNALAQIFDMKLKSSGLRVDDQTRKIALDMLSRARNQPHFGNAGEVDIILNRAKEEQQRRIATNRLPHTDQLEAQDFDADFDRGERAVTNCRKLFEGVVGSEEVVSKLEDYQKIAANMRAMGEDPRQGIPFNFLFRGPPGTGKTTTARKMGKVFYDMGFLSKAEVVEVSATELIGEYIGQTGPKTQKLLEKSLGKVLFIDEAYRLAAGGFAKEAMDELVDCLTKTKYAQRLVTILAGYDKDINQLMAMNPGLTSRFPEAITFHHLSPEHCLDLFTIILRRYKKLDISCLDELSEVRRTVLLKSFLKLSQLPGWGNGRDVGTLAKNAYGNVLKSATVSAANPQLLLEWNEVSVVINHMITERSKRAESVALESEATAGASPPTLGLAPPQALTAPPTSFSQKHGVEVQTIASSRDKPDSTTLGETQVVAARDDGVSEAIWQQLQEDTRTAEAQEAVYQTLLEDEEEIIQLQSDVEATQREEANASPPADDEERRRREQERIRREKDRRRIEAELEKMRQKRKAEEEERRSEQKAQQKLREMGVCCMGYRWIKQAQGYRCAGGSHYVSNSQLGI